MKKKHFTVNILLLAFFCFIFFILSFINCNSRKETNHLLVNLTAKVDPDIVLVNIGDGDRSSIANLLLKIDSCSPSIIAIDAWFPNERDRTQDSVLIVALKNIQNDILSYTMDSTGKIIKSHEKFRMLVKDEGLAITQSSGGLLNEVTPIQLVENKPHEQFALKIINQWKPEFKSNFRINQSIPINFTRTLDEFIHIDVSELEFIDCNSLKGKVILIGYLGPRNDDKHFTPIRFVKEYPKNKPDTYGLVIIANEIRTILEYGRK